MPTSVLAHTLTPSYAIEPSERVDSRQAVAWSVLVVSPATRTADVHLSRTFGSEGAARRRIADIAWFDQRRTQI